MVGSCEARGDCEKQTQKESCLRSVKEECDLLQNQILKPGIQEIDFSGKKLKFDIPLDSTPVMMKNYQKSLRNLLNKKFDGKDLLSYISSGSTLLTEYNVQLKFNIVNDSGEELSYISTPDGVFSIVNEVHSIDNSHSVRRLFDSDNPDFNIDQVRNGLRLSCFSFKKKGGSSNDSTYDISYSIESGMKEREIRDFPDGRTISKDFYPVERTSGRYGDSSGLGWLEMHGVKMKTFALLEKENPDLTEEDYVKQVKDKIKTKEQYFAFENFFQEDKGLSEYAVLDIRNHGKEVTGIADQERQFEERYRVELDFDIEFNNPNHYIRCSRFSLNVIEEKIVQLSAMIEKYPPVFLKNSGLKEIYLFSNWQIKNSDGKWEGDIPAFHSNNKVAVDNVFVGFDHELLHCVDLSYGGMQDDNEEWGKSVYGENYEKFYGKDVREKVRSGLLAGERVKGFAWDYGIEEIDEDQATIMGAIMKVDKDVLNDIPVDPVLEKKVKMAKEFYYIVSEGRMDPKFWIDFMRGREKIDYKYWEKREKTQDFIKTPELEAAMRAYENRDKGFLKRLKGMIDSW